VPRAITGHYEFRPTEITGVLSVVWVDGTAEGEVTRINERRVPSLAEACAKYMGGTRWEAAS